VDVRVVLEPDADTDPADAERLGRQLRNELRALDVEQVAVVEDPEPPAGAKSGAAASLTEWLVTLSAGGGVFVTLIATLRDWLGRRAGAHTVTVTIDGDTLELSNASPGERAELIETFVRRHQAGV
jgi:Effector Associated Constant Component 1